MKDIQSISNAQYDDFTRLWAGNITFADGMGNNRLVQPLGNRTLVKSKYNITSLEDRETELSTFLLEGTVTFSSYSFSERSDRLQVILAAVLTPSYVLGAIIIALLIYKLHEASKKISKLTELTAVEGNTTAREMLEI